MPSHTPKEARPVTAPARASNDACEREAARIAERMIRPSTSSADDIPRLTTKAPAARRTEATLQSSSGQPLELSARQSFERRLGHDFSRVRVHTDARAVESARRLGAAAYTLGSDIVFGEGQYAPTTPAGRRLLAHEIVHVVQQRHGPAVVQRQATTVVRAGR